MQIALIGPSHWHYPMYEPGLRACGTIVGVSDDDSGLAARIAERHGCHSWTDMRDMLDAVRPDFVFAFGAHRSMPAIADELIGRGLPFSIEKPCGVVPDDVRRIRAKAEARGLFVSIPFHYRLGGLLTTLTQFTKLPTQDLISIHIRMNAGSPLRFLPSSPWLTDPEISGGGCWMNLGHHAVDLLHCLTGSRVLRVTGDISSKQLGLAVEDTANMVLTLDDRTLATIETGYSFVPWADEHLDFSITLNHRDFVARRETTALRVIPRSSGTPLLLPTDWDSKALFARYVANTIHRFVNSEPPAASLSDLERTMQVVAAGYRAAGRGFTEPDAGQF